MSQKIILSDDEARKLRAFLARYYRGRKGKKPSHVVTSGNTKFRFPYDIMVAGDLIPSGTECTIFQDPGSNRSGLKICMFKAGDYQYTLINPNKVIRIDLSTFGIGARVEPLLVRA